MEKVREVVRSVRFVVRFPWSSGLPGTRFTSATEEERKSRVVIEEVEQEESLQR